MMMEARDIDPQQKKKLRWSVTTSCDTRATEIHRVASLKKGLKFSLATVLFALVESSFALEGTGKENWYGRYPVYPEYCSTPSQMGRRTIPPLKSSSVETSLRQVITVIRHGARTPYSAHGCWSDYFSPSSDTAVWDCDLTTMTSTPRRWRSGTSNGGSDDTSDVNDPSFLFEKRYDALNDPPLLKNSLNGTCQMGQLLLRGYEQQIANGKMLREAYVKDGTSNEPIMDDMVLFDFTDTATDEPFLWEEPNLYVRADDDQRTMMSGQVLLRGLFGDIIGKRQESSGNPIIKIHTADRSQDIISPSPRVCPILNELEAEAEASDGFQAFLDSDEAQTMERLIQEELGGRGDGRSSGWDDFADDALDCLMTTICTDLSLPNIIDDFKRPEGIDENSGRLRDTYGENLFERLANYSIRRYTYVTRYNDAAYAKLGIAPLWAEILKKVYRPDTKATISDMPVDASNPPTPKLVLFSGHDTTIMPLLASLGGGDDLWNGDEWPPYASMVLIEIHSVINDGGSINARSGLSSGGVAFRLLHDGRILTPMIPKCPSDYELCDLSVLLDIVGPHSDLNCFGKGLTDSDDSTKITFSEIFTSPVGMLSIFLAALLWFVIGGCFTYLYIFPYSLKGKKLNKDGDVSTTTPLNKNIGEDKYMDEDNKDKHII